LRLNNIVFLRWRGGSDRGGKSLSRAGAARKPAAADGRHEGGEGPRAAAWNRRTVAGAAQGLEWPAPPPFLKGAQK